MTPPSATDTPDSKGQDRYEAWIRCAGGGKHCKQAGLWPSWTGIGRPTIWALPPICQFLGFIKICHWEIFRRTPQSLFHLTYRITITKCLCPIIFQPKDQSVSDLNFSDSNHQRICFGKSPALATQMSWPHHISTFEFLGLEMSPSITSFQALASRHKPRPQYLGSKFLFGLTTGVSDLGNHYPWRHSCLGSIPSAPWESWSPEAAHSWLLRPTDLSVLVTVK